MWVTGGVVRSLTGFSSHIGISLSPLEQSFSGFYFIINFNVRSIAKLKQFSLYSYLLKKSKRSSDKRGVKSGIPEAVDVKCWLMS